MPGITQWFQDQSCLGLLKYQKQLWLFRCVNLPHNFVFLQLKFCFAYSVSKTALIDAAIICHWIDSSFVFHEALLNFKHMKGHHYSETWVQEIFDVMEEYEISKKWFYITTDNAGNNTMLVKCLSTLLKNAKGIEWDLRKHHISYLNHDINLAVQNFLRSIKAIVIEKDEGNESPDSEDDIEEFSPERFARAMFKI